MESQKVRHNWSDRLSTQKCMEPLEVKRHGQEIECGVLWSTLPEHLLFWQLQSSLDHSFCLFTAQSRLGVHTWACKGGWLSKWIWLPLRCLTKQTHPCLILPWTPLRICPDTFKYTSLNLNFQLCPFLLPSFSWQVTDYRGANESHFPGPVPHVMGFIAPITERWSLFLYLLEYGLVLWADLTNRMW